MALTIAQAIARSHQLQRVSDSFRLDTELLLAHTLSVRREYLHTWPELELQEADLGVFEQLFARRIAGEPLAYIVGRKDFWDFQLAVNPHVLIPRPETELLVETALELIRQQQCAAGQIVDLGTGSGAIAIALARELPGSRIIAVDRCSDALCVARMNVERQRLKNIQCSAGFWCEGLAENSVDLLLANPPYVAADDRHLQQGDLRFEPEAALVAADEGLADIKLIVAQSVAVLRSKAWLLIEHGCDQGEQVGALFAAAGFGHISLKQDIAGLDRLTLGQLG